MFEQVQFDKCDRQYEPAEFKLNIIRFRKVYQ